MATLSMVDGSEAITGIECVGNAPGAAGGRRPTDRDARIDHVPAFVGNVSLAA